jgi:hypothetical protein
VFAAADAYEKKVNTGRRNRSGLRIVWMLMTMFGVEWYETTHYIPPLSFYASICTSETSGDGDEGPLKQRFSPQKNDPD